MNVNSKYFSCYGRNYHAKIILICFPFAGGGASTYSKWKKYFSEDLIQVLPVQLPGRENRYEETEYELNIETMAKELAKKTNEFIDRPYVVFGHSMGGAFAYEFSKEMIKMYNKVPKYLFISGTVAPHKLHECVKIDSKITEEQFMKLLNHYNGMDSEVMETPELFEYFMPVIKRDFYSIARYNLVEKTILNVPIHVLYGKDDSDMTDQNILQWKEYTSIDFKESVFDGGHFYIKDSSKEVCKLIEKELSQRV